MTREQENLVEAVVTAWRPRGPDGTIQFHPAWHDLDASGRLEAFQRSLEDRVLEQALDLEGLSSTAQAVLGRLPRR
jgi:hypothetical protein